MVGTYEPYVEVCRRLAELSPCTGGEQKSMLVNSGAEAVENAVKIARAATGRPAVVVFDTRFHGRTLLTMTMTEQGAPVQGGLRPVRARGLPRAGAVPVPRHLAGRRDRGARAALQERGRPGSVACVVLEPVQGEGGFIPMPPTSRRGCTSSATRTGSSTSTTRCRAGVGRTGPVWAIEHYGVEPDLLVSGKSLGGGLPLAAVTGRAELMDAAARAGSAARSAATRVACAAAAVVLDAVAAPEFRARASARRRRCAARLDELAARAEASATCAGSARCWRWSWRDAEPRPRRRRGRGRARARAGAALVRAVRQRDPPARAARPIADDDLERGSGILEESLAAGRLTRRRRPASPALRKRYGDVARSTASTSRSGAASSSRMLGPSGSGKTTTLRMIAGFERPDAAAIRLGGVDISDAPPYAARREHGVPGLRALPAHDRGGERRVRAAREGVAAASGAAHAGGARASCGSTGYGDRKPMQLSGGQRQRVALARAIVNRPRVLLLDEPLGALDLKLRQEMQVFLKRIQQELGKTFVYVTHDQEEALTMSDRIAVFNEGRIEQVGSPAEVYEQPRTEFVAGFVGVSNILERDGRRFTIRPEKIRLLGEGGARGRRGGRIERRISNVVYVGAITRTRGAGRRR